MRGSLADYSSASSCETTRGREAGSPCPAAASRRRTVAAAPPRPHGPRHGQRNAIATPSPSRAGTPPLAPAGSPRAGRSLDHQNADPLLLCLGLVSCPKCRVVSAERWLHTAMVARTVSPCCRIRLLATCGRMHTHTSLNQWWHHLHQNTREHHPPCNPHQIDLHSMLCTAAASVGLVRSRPAARRSSTLRSWPCTDRVAQCRAASGTATRMVHHPIR